MSDNDSMIDPDDPQGSAALQRVLAEGLAPVDPHGPRRIAMRERLLERAHLHAQIERSYLTILAEQGEWQNLSAGIRAKALCRDPASRSFLLELKQGAMLPPHRHFRDEECVVLNGTMLLENVRARPGAYHVAPAGSRHGRIQAETNALIYLRGTSIGDDVDVLRDLVGAWLPRRGRAPLTVQPEQGTWSSFAPGVETKLLWESGELCSLLLRIEPETYVSVRAHRQAEEWVMLEGEAFFGDTLLRSGDYRFAPADSPHPRVYSDVGALLFMRGALR